tara:strand:+ start:253 stop:522 length:270 start_codon:yes stop_codon:yes gene_type:complete
MPPVRKRSVRDREHAKLKEAYGTDCARLYFGLLCVVALLVAVSVANDAAINLVFGAPPAPPPPPPPTLAKHGLQRLVEGLGLWGRAVGA